MELAQHDLSQLFAQLGLPDDKASIERFIAEHRPLPEGVKLSEAEFWSPSQASFLREGLRDDADWAPLVDTLNVCLRDQPVLPGA